MVFLWNIASRLLLTLSFASLCVSPSYAEDSGTWTNPKTGLTWQRCSLGQTWSGYGCDGEPKAYTWDDAQQAAKAVGDGWRVPAASELLGLVRCNTGFRGTESVPNQKGEIKVLPSLCNEGASRPTIDNAIFPSMKAIDSYFWSSSSVSYNRNMAWVVIFYSGRIDGLAKFATYHVRLVRSNQ